MMVSNCCACRRWRNWRFIWQLSGFPVFLHPWQGIYGWKALACCMSKPTLPSSFISLIYFFSLYLVGSAGGVKLKSDKHSIEGGEKDGKTHFEWEGHSFASIFSNSAKGIGVAKKNTVTNCTDHGQLHWTHHALPNHWPRTSLASYLVGLVPRWPRTSLASYLVGLVPRWPRTSLASYLVGLVPRWPRTSLASYLVGLVRPMLMASAGTAFKYS